MIINKTPHNIEIETAKGTIVFRAELPATRVVESSALCGTIDGINVVTTTYLHVDNIPPETPGVYYIVSLLVKQFLPNRKDLLVPVGLVRDEKGRIVGCRYLSKTCSILP